MKPLLFLPLTLTAVLLCGCPDAKVPKVPPKAPEPKAVADTAMLRQLPEVTLRLRPNPYPRFV